MEINHFHFSVFNSLKKAEKSNSQFTILATYSHLPLHPSHIFKHSSICSPPIRPIMDRYRGGDRYNNNPNDSQPYRHPRGGGGPPPSRSSDDSPINRHRGGFSGNRRPFDNSPPRYSVNSGGGFRPVDGDGGFRPVGMRNTRNYNNPSSEFEVPLSGPRFNADYEVPLSGQKRPYDFPGFLRGRGKQM